MKQTTKRAIKTIATILLFFVIFITNTHIVNASEYAKYNKRNDIENYVVKENDTLENIAFNNGFTVQELAKLNNIKDVNNLTVNEVITLSYENAMNKDLIFYSNNYQKESNKNDVTYETARQANLLNEYYMLDNLKFDHNINKHIFKYVKNNKLYTTKMTIKQIKNFVIDHNVNEKFYIDDLSNL